jgi:CRISPR type III-A-associated protein Csm2
MSRINQGRGGGGPSDSGPSGQTANTQCHFDPAKSDADLFDTLAEQQANAFPNDDRDKVKPSQLRRYFSELKGLYNQFRALAGAEVDEAKRQAIFAERIDARFRMLRSKIAYGKREAAGQTRGLKAFCDVLDQGINKVKNAKDFERFVLHVEAVVGFMYGNHKVSNKS